MSENPQTRSEESTDSAQGTTVLACDSISQSYGDVEVLEDVSVEIESGDLTALVGPNGSGKTTLLRILSGLLAPTTGSVEYTVPEADRKLGYVPQHPSFRADFTVRETLSFYTTLVDDDPGEVLQQVGLEDAADRRVDALSGGMVRLLGIGQASVGDPPIVVLDEPGSGLDPGIRRRIFDFARELAVSGTAVLYSSHDLANVGQYADRVLVLDGGQIVAADSPERLRDQYDVESLWEVYRELITDPAGKVEVLGGDT